MSNTAWLCAIPLLLVACQKSPGAYEQEGQPGYEQGGTNGYEQPRTQPGGTDGFGPGRPSADQPMVRPDMPQAVQRLRQDVEQLRSGGEIQYMDLTKSLRDLSSALQTLPSPGATLTDAVSRIGSYADRIEAAGATSNMHTRWARRALNEGVDALEGYQKERGFTGMADRFVDLRGQLDQIDPDRPFSEQKDLFVDTLDQLSNVLVDVSAPPQEPGTR